MVGQGLVVDCFVQILHKHIPRPRLTQDGVPAAPHDTAGATSDLRVVRRIQSTFGVTDGVEIHIGIAQRLTGDVVPAHTNRGNRAHRDEDFIQNHFGYIGMQIPHVQAGKLGRSGLRWRRHFLNVFRKNKQNRGGNENVKM